MIVINPGAGDTIEGTVSQSEINIKQFIADLGVDATYEFIELCKNSRHSYRLHSGGKSHVIDIPALPLQDVRYIAEVRQNAWHFPRLYVDGVSWLWYYALQAAFAKDED